MPKSLNSSSPSQGDDSSSPNRRNPPRACKGKRKADEEIHAEPQRIRREPNPADQSSSYSKYEMTDHMARFLASIRDPRCKAEIQRYLDLDETKYFLPFPKEDLPRMLCAAFPLRPELVRAVPGQEQFTDEQCQFPKPPLPPGITSWQDPNLFRWYTLKEGYMPRGLNALLAKKDAKEMERIRKARLAKEGKEAQG